MPLAVNKWQRPKTDPANISERKTVYDYGSAAPGNLVTKPVNARDVVDSAGRPATLTSSFTYTADQCFLETETNPARHRSIQAVDAATGQFTCRQAVQNGPAVSMTYDALRQVGATTAGQVRAAGGQIVSSPTAPNRNHAMMSGITPQQAEQIFTPTAPNPNRGR